MNFLDKKEQKHDVKLSTYASGDGSLTLCFLSKNGELADLRVTKRDVEEYQKRRFPDWDIHYNGQDFKLYQAVERVGPDEVRIRNRNFIYRDYPRGKVQIVVNEEMKIVRNNEIISAIRFFLQKEKEDARNSG